MKVLLTGLLWLTGLAAFAELQQADTKESLRGLNGFYIHCEFVDLQPDGLTTNGMEAVVKAALDSAGIGVDEKPLKIHGDANLSVVINTVKDPQLGVYLFTVHLEVSQEVQLVRPAHVPPLSAETWSRTIQGLTTPDRTDIIQQALKQCLDQFVASYQAVNPKAQKITP